MTKHSTLKLAAILLTLGAFTSQSGLALAKSVKPSAAKPSKSSKAAPSKQTKAKAFSFNSGQPLLMSPSMKKSMKRKPRRRARTKRRMKRFVKGSMTMRMNRHASAMPTFDDNKDLANRRFDKKLSRRNVNRTIRRRTKALYRCRGFAIGPRAVTVKLSVKRSGRVGGVKVLSGTRIERSPFTRCLTRRINNWTFPRSNAATPVSFSFRTR